MPRIFTDQNGEKNQKLYWSTKLLLLWESFLSVSSEQHRSQALSPLPINCIGWSGTISQSKITPSSVNLITIENTYSTHLKRQIARHCSKHHEKFYWDAMLQKQGIRAETHCKSKTDPSVMPSLWRVPLMTLTESWCRGNWWWPALRAATVAAPMRRLWLETIIYGSQSLR